MSAERTIVGINGPGSFENRLGFRIDTDKPPQVDIGPHSLLWKYLGDPRIGVTGMSAGILQLMHPGVGAGVLHHSDFFNDPWGRVLRSLPQIVDVVYSPQGVEIGKKIRDYHLNIRGEDNEGRSYHALAPETFWWPHATFHHMVEELPDRFDWRPLTSAQKEQLYAETSTWYGRYAVTDKPVPPTYAAFKEKWNDICDNVLEMTPAATTVIDAVTNRTVTPFPNMPTWIWEHGAKLPLNEVMRLLAIGGLPERVRERFDIPWSRTDQKKLGAIERSAKFMWLFNKKIYRDRPGDLLRTLGRLDRSLLPAQS